MNDRPRAARDRQVILVVDDAPEILECVHGLFAAEADVLFATSGQEAMELAYIHPPDLILMDIVMPGMDGYETCRRFREQASSADLPLIFLTALGAEEDEAKGLALGAIDFIHKPFNPEILQAKVRNHLLAKVQQDIYKSQALRDQLTGLPNRRHFDDTLIKEWERGVRGCTELAFLMIDVDRFKAYNDHLGHLEGDRCLAQVAAAMEAALPRRIDFLARYGGEEFAAILPATSLLGALRVGETLRAAVEALEIPAPFLPAGRLTVSVGAASLVPTLRDQVETLAVRADKGLYNAKRDGRNRVGVEDIGFRIQPGPLAPREAIASPEPPDQPLILLVDDDARMRLLMEARLATMGTRIATFPEAGSASTLLSRQTPDLILSDVVMPGMDGFEFCRQCKLDSQLTGVPFVLLTAVSRNLRERALGAGADDYLSKMEMEQVFRMRVRTHLELGLNRASETVPAGAQVLLLTRATLVHQVIATQMEAAGIGLRTASDWAAVLEALAGAGADTLVLDAAMLTDLPPQWFDRLRDMPAGLNLPILALASPQEDEFLLKIEHELQDRSAKPLEAREVRHRLLLMLRLAQARRGATLAR